MSHFIGSLKYKRSGEIETLRAPLRGLRTFRRYGRKESESASDLQMRPVYMFTHHGSSLVMKIRRKNQLGQYFSGNPV
ncbi:hypothetical protein RvY_02013 [Ramazzottius varieornatus]|uniref:Uncharacterized protein n=1 Tax=Ramazzottius varieornatus TaxID=947166 RepID=A0A1D1UIA7_RAMVA|nr:hypothetical protein RvY_02013 [Ramazzottius varieornatus]